MSRLRTLEDLGPLAGRRAFVRADLNVPLAGGEVADDLRIRAALPTIEALREREAAIVLASHLGRPKGAPEDALRLDPVARALTEAGGFEVDKLDEVTGEAVEKTCETLGPGGVVLLENLRFDPGETANDAAFAAALASLADVYVGDAFGAVHRAHASVVGVPERLPQGAGLLLGREIEVLSRLRDDPEEPYVAVLGGAKVADKLGVVASLIERVDALLVGGAMAFTFIEAQGGEVGASLVERNRLDDVRETLRAADDAGVLVVLPEDVVVAPEASLDVRKETVPANRIPSGLKGLDVGPRTVEEFTRVIGDAATVFWNGPMGVFELEPFSLGTRGVAQAVSAANAFTVVGGGDSAAALRRLDMQDAVGHLSTGGGAALEFLEGKDLPGIRVLMEG